MNQETTRTPTPVRQFTILLSATRRGARLARLLAGEQLRAWGLPFEAAEQIVAELASNAALHGYVPGRSFRLALRLTEAATLRIEVTDARADRSTPVDVELPPAYAESGRGLFLVAALSDRWGTELGSPPCKTIWAEIATSTPTCPTPAAPSRPDPLQSQKGAARSTQ
ncbi:ATP-binding protein [Streptomyces sp. BA2]|uniref:ATP-binding protein n=1 Tax=Streptomyces sp. BA2 TaxID=436595 RepID=UPI00132AAFB5|nr:ATP-binding protein [Streptomyces sp. BA2]